MGILPLSVDEVPQYSRIVADSDMDGLFGAAVLKAFRPEAASDLHPRCCSASRTG